MFNQWKAAGALASNVITSAKWELRTGGGALQIGSGPDLKHLFPSPGQYVVDYKFSDMLGRSYSNTLTVRVLAPTKYTGVIGISAATTLSLF